MEGWIKLHRSLLDWEWIDDPNTLAVFIYCLLRANHQPTKHQGTVMEAGQLKTGRKQLAKNTGLSERQVRTALKKLKSTSEVTIQSTNSYSIITVVNWEKYQDCGRKSTSETTSKETSKRPASDQQVTTDKNEKNDNNGKKKEKKEGKKKPPSFDEFKEYALGKAEERELDIDLDRVFYKYEAWRENNWRTGKGKKIENWKTTLLNTLPYLQKEKVAQKRKTDGDYSREIIEQFSTGGDK